MTILRVVSDFNSIKVQLEHDMQRYYTDFMLFQFHKGTIRTKSLSDASTASPYFNSIKVQLEHNGFVRSKNFMP